MDGGERGTNPVEMTIINHRKKYWPSRGSNRRLPVLKSCTLPTKLCGSAQLNYELTLNQTEIFGPIQIQSICRRQNNRDSVNEVVSGGIENIVGKGENAGYQHFLLFPQCFQKVFLSRGVKSRECLIKNYSNP